MCVSKPTLFTNDEYDDEDDADDDDNSNNKIISLWGYVDKMCKEIIHGLVWIILSESIFLISFEGSPSARKQIHFGRFSLAATWSLIK